MTHEDISFLSADGATTCVGDLLIPEGEPQGIVQIVHGMVEHILCYEDFARELVAAGYAVCGIDQLGHSRTTPDPKQRGVYDPTRGAGQLIEDQHTLRTHMQERLPGLPYVMVGHSMGSFVLRCYIARHGEGLAGAIIMGSAWQPRSAIGAMKVLCTMIGVTRGWDTRSRFIDSMAVGSYNKAFEGSGARTGYEWLSRDERRPIAYAADPDCGWMFSISGYYMMMSLLYEAESRIAIARIPRDLPVLLLSGSEDPVGNMGEGPEKCAAVLREAGLTDVTLRLYEGARHELHNETCAKEVLSEIVAFLDRVCGVASSTQVADAE